MNTSIYIIILIIIFYIVQPIPRNYLIIKENLRTLFTKYYIAMSHRSSQQSISQSIANLSKYTSEIYSRTFALELSRWLIDFADSKDIRSSSYEFAIVLNKLYKFDLVSTKILLINCVEGKNTNALLDNLIALSDTITWTITKQKPLRMI